MSEPWRERFNPPEDATHFELTPKCYCKYSYFKYVTVNSRSKWFWWHYGWEEWTNADMYGERILTEVSTSKKFKVVDDGETITYTEIEKTEENVMSEKPIVIFKDKEYEVVDVRLPKKGEVYLAIGGVIRVATQDWSVQTRTVLEPVKWVPKMHEWYFVPTFGEEGCRKFSWTNHFNDIKNLEQDLVCKTEEEARQLHEALTGTIKAFRAP